MPDLVQTHAYIIGAVFLCAAVAMGIPVARDLVPEELASSIKMAAFICFGLFAALMIYEMLPRVFWPPDSPRLEELPRQAVPGPPPAPPKKPPPVSEASPGPQRPKPNIREVTPEEAERLLKKAAQRPPSAGSKPVIREIDEEEAKRLMDVAARQSQRCAMPFPPCATRPHTSRARPSSTARC